MPTAQLPGKERSEGRERKGRFQSASTVARPHGSSLPSSASTCLATRSMRKQTGVAIGVEAAKMQWIRDATMIADVKKKKSAWRTCASQTQEEPLSPYSLEVSSDDVQ
jgi:hypothetical protein